MNQFQLSALLSIAPSVEVSVDSTDARSDYFPELQEMGLLRLKGGYYSLTLGGELLVKAVMVNVTKMLSIGT